MPNEVRQFVNEARLYAYRKDGKLACFASNILCIILSPILSPIPQQGSQAR
jgi:hypothetical protein